MADIEEFVVVETPPELKRSESPSKESSPVPEDNPVPPPAEDTPAVEPEPEKEKTPEPADTQEDKADEQPTTEVTEDKQETEEEKKEEPVEETVSTPSKEDDTADKTEATEDDKTTEVEPQATADQPKDEQPPVDEKKDEQEPEAVAGGETDKQEETAAQEEPTPADTQPEPEPEPEQTKKRAPIAISGKQIKQLLTGTEMLKAKKGTKVYPRLYYVTHDLIRLVWNSKRKPLAKSQIALSQIIDVVPGRTTDSFKLYRGTQDEELCFSIVYQDNGAQRTLDLIVRSPEEASLWTNGLLALTGNGVTENTAELRKKWLRTLFDEADANGDGTLDLKEVVKMFKRLNIGVSQKKLRIKFKAADSDGNGDNKLDFDEFCKMFADFSERPELRVLFNLYATSDDGSYMTAEDLLNFLHTEQDNEDATIEYCQSLIERFEPSDAGQRYLLTVDGFAQYLVSDDNDIFKREHSQIYQDMTQPLAHYFIASSHNTYLLEDQLSGPSSVDAYIRALQRGCRCVELDCWDGDDNEPIIYHGHTLTSKILFKDCIQAIKEHAFTTSPYPVILSIENHCSVAQQHVIADYLSSILGDMLHNEDRDETLGKLPSPEDLKYKILIKAKKLPKEHEDKDDDDGEVSDEDEGAEVDKEEVEKVKSAAQASPAADDPDVIPDGPEEPKTEQNEVRKVVRDRTSTIKEDDSAQKPAAKRKLSSKLSKCVNYVQSVHFKGFEESVNAPFYHMSSFGESSAFKHSETKAASYIEYNKKHLSRTYPAGRRVDSSNYEPVDLWNSGCQIVALNYQTPGKPMDFNIGKFQQNGGSGYILKPEVMREDYTHFNHKDKESMHGVTPKLVSIRVISGQRLPKPEGGSKDGEIIDPYVVVKFTGIDKAEYRTRRVDDNGFNPVWNERFTQVVTFPELALVRFAVYDYDLLSQDDFIGQYTLPLNSINTGYHTIKLRSTNWEIIEGATLFVEVRIQDYVGPTPKTKVKPRFVQIKKARQYPLMKPVSFPAVDNIFRKAKQTIHVSTDLREDYHYQLLLFKDQCGKSSIPDCMEAISAKAHSARIQLKLVTTETSKGLIYQVEVAGENTTSRQTGVSGSLLTIMDAFNKLNGIINTVLNLSEVTASELDDYHTQALAQKDEFFQFLSQPVQQKKAPQLKHNYSNNVRTLKNEVLELRLTCDAATKVLEKIPKFAEKFGIPVTAPPKPDPEPVAEQVPTQEPEPTTTKTDNEPNKEQETPATTTTTAANDEVKPEQDQPEEVPKETTASGDDNDKGQESAGTDTKKGEESDETKEEGTDC